MQDPHDGSRRRYEEAVLAALDFEPRAPFLRRRGWLVAALVLVHIGFAVTFADALSADWGAAPLVLAGLAWLAGTVLVTRAIFRTGVRAALG